MVVNEVINMRQLKVSVALILCALISACDTSNQAAKADRSSSLQANYLADQQKPTKLPVANRFMGFDQNTSEQNQLAKLVKSHIAMPDSYLAIGGDRYLVNITNTGRVFKGIYFVDISDDMVEQVAGGSANLITTQTDTTQHLWAYFKSTSLNKGIQKTEYFGCNCQHSQVMHYPNLTLYLSRNRMPNSGCVDHKKERPVWGSKMHPN